MSDFENSSVGKLAKFLDEGEFQVTFTGWKAELEREEQKNKALRAQLAVAVKALEEIKLVTDNDGDEVEIATEALAQIQSSQGPKKEE